jgi:hypothetical protein
VVRDVRARAHGEVVRGEGPVGDAATTNAGCYPPSTGKEGKVPELASVVRDVEAITAEAVDCVEDGGVTQSTAR